MSHYPEFSRRDISIMILVALSYLAIVGALNLAEYRAENNAQRKYLTQKGIR